ncbi:hypothetical protein SCLCIDRAFT_1220873 [Scleroderma citrinum Foug A]|uniref:Uncharacterized protein n=1 Tax=Scleroderma citrinum Foug A TaxID=1036808 RepID=A0A0C3DHR0_9AGAM|nr:hypothetical protein SCLCIDRAFT_1220873 [Scleroderma citrinum Foug A]
MVPQILVQIILQMRLYVLYNHSKRIMFVVVLGFIIEITVMIVISIIRTTGNILVEDVDIIGFSVSFAYDLLLFSLALWAAIQCLRRSSPATQSGARHLRVILIEGNVIYFLALLLYLLIVMPLFLVTRDVEFLDVASNFFCCFTSITGCRLILDIRSATSQSSAGTNASHGSEGQTYSLVVFHDPITHSSTNDDAALE